MRYVSKCIPKQMRLQPLPENVGTERRVSEVVRQRVPVFQAIGPATENALWPSVLRWCRGTRRWWRLEDWSSWRLATSDVGWQQFMRYWGALPWRHNTHTEQEHESVVSSADMPLMFWRCWLGEWKSIHPACNRVDVGGDDYDLDHLAVTDVTICHVASTFKRHLKTELFFQAYGVSTTAWTVAEP